jgi:hypothetical protein
MRWGVGGVVLCVALEESTLEFFRVLTPLVTVRLSSFSRLSAARWAASSRLMSGKLKSVGEPRPNCSLAGLRGFTGLW